MTSFNFNFCSIRNRIAISIFVLATSWPVGAQEADVKRLNQKAVELYQEGRYKEGAIVATEALNLAEKSLGPDHPDLVASLNSRARLHGVQSEYAAAEPLFKRALAIREKSLGADHPEVANSLSNLAALYSRQRQYARAEPLIQRSLAIREKSFGMDHPSVAASLNNLAALYSNQGQYAQAEPLIQRSLAIREKSLGADHPSVAASLTDLARSYFGQGLYAQAEIMYRRALTIYEKALGPDHPDLLACLNPLAELLFEARGQRDLAEALYKRALAIGEKAFGPDDPRVANSLSNMAYLYIRPGQYDQAEALYLRALAIREKTDPEGGVLAQTLNDLALLYRREGKSGKAQALLIRALAIREKVHGPDNYYVAQSINNLALIYQDQRKYEQAEVLHKRSLEINEKAFGREHPDVARSLNNLGRLYAVQGQYPAGLAVARRASAIYRERIIDNGNDDDVLGETSRNEWGFFGHLSLLARNPDHESSAKIADESFQVAQLAQASGTASAIAKMAARFAPVDDELAALIKRRQDAAERVRKQSAQRLALSGKPPEQRNAAIEQKLRDSITTATKEAIATDAELIRRYPEYQELARPEPLSIDQVRALLKPGEAMLVYALGNRAFAWLVTAGEATFVQLSVNDKEIGARVSTVRAQMEWDSNLRLPPVDVASLHYLYEKLLGPLQVHLAAVKHLIVVPAKALQSLPFGMLVVNAPPKIESVGDYRKVDWLARHYSISVLPSVSSIQALRRFAKARQATEPFAGFGDPAIGERSGLTRGNNAKFDIASVFRSLAGKPNTITAVGGQVSEIADVDMIRTVQSLPETASELRAMAKALKADEKSIWLRSNATESNLKRLDLAKYRTLAFATHGVMAGELKGVGEPGLILTPPKIGSVEDDGYLSASEITNLKLNADWVILSACNTAAADGTPGAEGLSGLAKAFFYAGARSLLVSHWPVDSQATVSLTTGMLGEYEFSPAQGKAQAHQKAMLTLMNDPQHPEYAHPMFWAPFVVVGEGG
jgi:CHAT domain-containing protein/Tfp pilus assembly protein PilF